MKIITAIAALLFCCNTFAQTIKISNLPEHTGNPATAHAPIVIGGVTKKFSLGNFVYTGSSYSNPSWLTGLHPNKLLQGGASTGQALVWNGSNWVPSTISGTGSGLPSQTGNPRKFLTTDGTTASWGLPNFGDSVDYTGAGTGMYLRINPGGSGSKKYDFANVGGINTLTGLSPVIITGSGSSRDINIDSITRPSGVTTLGKWAKDSALLTASIASKSGKVYAGNGLTNVNDSTLRTDTSTAVTGTATNGYVLDLFNRASNASNLALGTVPDARLSSNVPLLNNNNTFRYVGTAPLAGGTFFGQKTNNYVTGGLSYNSGSHILVGNYFYDTIKFNGHNQTAYGVQISPTFINSGGYAETDRKALVVDGNTLINGNLQLTGTLTFPGVLSASSFDATTSFRLNGTNILGYYWSGGMVSIGSVVTGTLIQNFNNNNHILYANNASNSIAIGQGTGYPTAAPANGLGVVGSIGAGTLSPNSTLSTAGSFSTAFSSKTTTYTATASDYTITADATSAAFSITLPTAVGINGRIYVIKKVDASGNAVTVATTSSQTIDDNTTYSLSSQYKYVMVQSNGSNWIIIGNN